MKETFKSPKWTYEDYLLFPDDGKRYEILRGEKFVIPTPVPRHQIASRNIQFALMKYLETHELGELLNAPIDVVLAEDSVVQPDLLFIARERLSIVGEKAITEAPDLVIEIRSPSTHKLDYVTKRQLYAEHGVKEYWIVDPEVERIEVFVLESGKLEKKTEVTSGEARSLVVLPGFGVDLRKVFG